MVLCRFPPRLTLPQPRRFDERACTRNAIPDYLCIVVISAYDAVLRVSTIARKIGQRDGGKNPGRAEPSLVLRSPISARPRSQPENPAEFLSLEVPRRDPTRARALRTTFEKR